MPLWQTPQHHEICANRPLKSLEAGGEHRQLHNTVPPPSRAPLTDPHPILEAIMAKEQRSTKEKRKPKKAAADKKGAKK
ncbi:MAG: hypothetical protein ABL893_11600 [Hyphomicrobium sp.]